MNKLTLFVILLITISCTSADNNSKKVKCKSQKGEPYNISLGINKEEGNTFNFEIDIKILHKGAYFISPFSDGDYKGVFTILFEDNSFLTVREKLDEIPKAKEALDPYSNKPSTWVKENTVYKQHLAVNTVDDFNVSGVIQFVIEPQCTMEKIGFTISKKGEKVTVVKTPIKEIKKQEPHNYGGWYCPDNLNGFPAIDIKEWASVPVVNDRLPTKEETRNGTSLMFIDIENYPHAKPLDITMPKLAKYYNEYSKKEELVIVIQAIKVQNDSVVGFRFLNGGNGSAWLNEVKFISEPDIDKITTSNFVSIDIKINAAQDDIWQIMTNPVFSKELALIYSNKNNSTWLTKSNINYKYASKDNMTSAYADKLFGCWYVQNDYLINNHSYVEKFLLLESQDGNNTELKIVCGPFTDDFEKQRGVLTNWAQKVKDLSEKEK